MDETSIGQRIRRYRGKAITQEALSEKSGVSKSLIRALEQDKRDRASIGSLHKIARALDVDIADLVGKRHAIPGATDASGIVAIRHALTSVDDLIDDTDADEPVSITTARRAVDYAWGSYWAGRYERLSAILPTGIAQLRATVREAHTGDVAPAHELQARMLWVTGCTLVHMGHADPAFIAIRQALDAANKGNDPLLAATLRGSVAWQLLVAGRYAESHAVAAKAAASMEPYGDVSDQQLSVYGSLVLQGATAAGRHQRPAEAVALAQVAGEVAERLGSDRKDYECNFGPSQVVMQTVDINISTERYPEALKAAKTMPNNATGLAQVSQARHLLDKAAALTRTGKHQAALDTVLTAERVGGPEWVKYQTLLRQVVSELREHDRQTPLRALAERIGLAA